MAPHKNSGEKGVHRLELFKSVNLKNAIRVRQNLRTGRKTIPCTKKDAPAEKHPTWRMKNTDKATFYSHTEAWEMPAPSSKKPEEREFVVDSGASFESPGTPQR